MKNIIRKHLERTAQKVWEKVVKDPRQKNKCEWSLSELMNSLFNGMLSGCKNLREVEDLSELSGERTPDTTLNDLIVRLDAEPLNGEIAKQVKEASRSHEFPKGEFPLRVVAVDGKSIYVSDRYLNQYSRRAVRNKTELYIHMGLRAMLVSSSTQVVLGQKLIDATTNECGAFPSFVDSLLELYGNTDLIDLISIDSGMVSAKNASYLIEKRLNYKVALKDAKAKPLTKFAIRQFRRISQPVKVQNEHQNGETITRELYRTPYKGEIKGWSHAKELWRIKKTVIGSNGKKKVKSRYFATSLAPSTLSNSQVLQVIRMHWKIENNSNWILDTAWQEDDSPWCSKALELISLLRIFAYNVVSRLKNRRLRKHRAMRWKILLEQIKLTLCASCRQNLASVSD